MPRYLAIDYGTKRMGFAVSDPSGTIATPLCAIRASGEPAADAERAARIGAREQIDEFVVGLPLNMDDTEGPQAKLCRAFAEALARLTGRTVHLQDERLSSFAAEQVLRQAELSAKRRKELQDSLAAQVILDAFLKSQ